MYKKKKVHGVVVVDNGMVVGMVARMVVRGEVVVKRERWMLVEVDEVDDVVPQAPASSPVYKIKRIIRNKKKNLTFVFSDEADEEAEPSGTNGNCKKENISWKLFLKFHLPFGVVGRWGGW